MRTCASSARWEGDGPRPLSLGKFGAGSYGPRINELNVDQAAAHLTSLAGEAQT
ncbi:hypothetical protein MPTA5024_24685 [Microbispora sp. ATCC PTA-5024]|nr:hypothetical protein MPTA5024_24685 [Microbispora sp. ATCC PTA-5024]